MNYTVILHGRNRRQTNFNQMGNPPTLPGDSNSLTFPAFDDQGTMLR